MNEVDNQAIEPAGALTPEQLAEVTQATESEPSEAEGKEQSEPEAKTETEPEGEAEQQEKAEPEESEDSEDEDKPKKARSGSARLKRENAYLRAELEAARSRQGDGQVSQDAVEKLVGKPPKEDDFKGDFLAYERALTVYEMRKANAEDRIREQGEQAKTARENARREILEDHRERLGEFKTKVADFDETMSRASTLKVMPHVEELVLESDNSAHLQYFLAKHPDRLARLNDMSEREAAREIGRIESRLSLPNPKKQTSAPAPIKTPKGGAAPSSPDKDLDSWLTKTYGKQ